MADDQEQIVQEGSGGEETAGTEVSQGQVEDIKPKYEALLKRVEGIEKANSAFQSEKDKAVKRANEAESRLKSLEKVIDGVKNRFGDDSDFLTTLDSERTKSELSYYKDRDAQEKAATKKAREIQEFIANTNEMIRALGVDPAHPDLTEAARGGKDPADVQRRLLVKAKEIAGSKSKVSKDDLASLKEELRAEIRKEMGLDSGDLIPPVGTAGKRLTRKDLQDYNPTGKTAQQIGDDVDAMLDQYYRKK